jgi:hypothetical protein
MDLATCKIVNRGFDPEVYSASMMDGRVKPGHDS